LFKEYIQLELRLGNIDRYVYVVVVVLAGGVMGKGNT
jgi:hypothetical protein